MNETSTSDPVSRVLLPVLVHEVNNATQLLVGLRALLDIPGGDALFAQRADDLARASVRMDELGFALAVLATASGAEMLLARRDPRSVRILWELTVHALERREEVALRCVGEPPLVAPSALDGWQPAWCAAAVLLMTADAAPAGEWRWRWEADGRLIGVGPPGASISDGSAASVGARAPGAEATFEDGRLTLRFPADWLA